MSRRMKRVMWLVGLVFFVSLGLLLDGITGNVARSPMPYPGVEPITFKGSITDYYGRQVPPGRLIADVNGWYAGEGGVTLVDYTLTLQSGWHEHLPAYHILYLNYDYKTPIYCTTLDLREVRQLVYYDIKCEFSNDVLVEETMYPIITKEFRKGEIWIT